MSEPKHMENPGIVIIFLPLKCSLLDRSSDRNSSHFTKNQEPNRYSLVNLLLVLFRTGYSDARYLEILHFAELKIQHREQKSPAMIRKILSNSTERGSITWTILPGVCDSSQSRKESIG